MCKFKQTILQKIADVEFCDAPASLGTIQSAQQELGCVFGKQLCSYLTDFGYLARAEKELYGINERQKCVSDMVMTTKMLHEDFPQTRQYVAVENLGDGDYILCDSQDVVFEFIHEENSKIHPLSKTLLSYILERLK